MSRRVLVACGLFMAVTVMTARGATIAQTASWSGNGSAVFDKFDPTLGTLQSAYYGVTFSDMNLSFTIKNERADAQSFDVMYSFTLHGSISGLFTPQLSGSGTFPGWSPLPLSIGANETRTYGPYATSMDGWSPNRLWTVFYAAEDLAALTGTGKLVVGAGGPEGQLFIGGWQDPVLLTLGVSHTWNTSVMLTYEYTPSSPPPSPPVPEPSSLALAGVGVAGLLGAAWRRRRRVAG